jgi:hypothetical protein
MKSQQAELINLPETGMGYQIVNITMKDGTLYAHMTVINSQFLQLDKNENIDINLIEKIEVSDKLDHHSKHN